MQARRRLDFAIVATAACVAVALPCAAAAHLSSRIQGALEPALTEALGEQVTIGGVEAGLTGELRVRDVRVGRIVAVAHIEASVALSSLLAGDLDADEIRIDQPHLRVRIDADGSSNLTRLVERAARHRAERARSGPASAYDRAQTPSATKQRRIVVTGGDLLVDVDGWGQVRLSGVALHPHAGGLRAVAGATHIRARRAAWAVTGRLERAAADLALPSLQVSRLLAVGGELDITARARDAALGLTRVSFGRGIQEEDALVVQGRVRDAAPARRRPGEPAGPPGFIARLSGQPGGLVARLQGQGLPLAVFSPLLPRSLDLSRARGHGHVELATGAPDGSLAVELDAAVDDLVIDDRRVAQREVTVAGRARMRAVISDTRPDTGSDTGSDTSAGATGRRIDIESFAFTTGALTAELSGHASYGPDTPEDSWLPDTGAVTAHVPPLACASALSSLPESLRHRLTGLDMTGMFTARAHVAFSRAEPAKTRLDLDIDVSRCRVLREALAADPTTLREPFEHVFPDGSRARIGPGQPGYTPLAALPNHVVRAFISAEDGRFYQHRGFDVRQIERSLAIDLRDSAFVRGGSTMSQQLVKNVFLSHRRTLARKLQEAVLTWRLEARLPKRVILERYLNIIELGPGVFGVGAAARHWFGKDPAELTVRESAFLAALTPAPRTLSRRIAAHRGVDDRMAERVDTVLRAMRRDRVLTERDYRRATGRPLALRAELLAAR